MFNISPRDVAADPKPSIFSKSAVLDLRFRLVFYFRKEKSTIERLLIYDYCRFLFYENFANSTTKLVINVANVRCFLIFFVDESNVILIVLFCFPNLLVRRANRVDATGKQKTIKNKNSDRKNRANRSESSNQLRNVSTFWISRGAAETLSNGSAFVEESTPTIRFPWFNSIVRNTHRPLDSINLLITQRSLPTYHFFSRICSGAEKKFPAKQKFGKAAFLSENVSLPL